MPHVERSPQYVQIAGLVHVDQNVLFREGLGNAVERGGKHLDDEIQRNLMGSRVPPVDLTGSDQILKVLRRTTSLFVNVFILPQALQFLLSVLL